ncbi:MAG TPA: GNAT family N-acetyltransferase [Solirubrobacteraceae bacterium]|jgi:ribosomal protein S18 acetylase RimI-like enzyme
MLRPATDADRESVLALGVGEEEAWFGQADLSTDEVGEWVDDEGGVTAGVVTVDDGGRVQGFASAGRRGSVFLAEPAHAAAVADELLPWLLEKRATVEVLTFAGDGERIEAFERHGLRHLRSSFFLVRPQNAGPLPAAAFPAGVEVARYRWGDDDEAVHRLIYVDAEWASVSGHTERDLAAWLGRDAGRDGAFLARRDEQPVGWVRSRILVSGRGYVNSLAVAKRERGQGLGRALLLHAFADLQAAGARGLALDVEAANKAALGLYRSVGLEIEREWRIYAA